MNDELTLIDIKKMQEEIDYRTTVVRPRIHEDIMHAKEFGDLSENAEYKEARREKSRNESRISYLQNMIRTAKIIQTNSQSDVVGIFDTVEVLFEDDNCVEKYVISTTLRRDAINNIISNKSPLGSAIFGKHTNDRVYVKLENGNGYYVKILSITKGTDDDNLPITKY